MPDEARETLRPEPPGQTRRLDWPPAVRLGAADARTPADAARQADAVSTAEPRTPADAASRADPPSTADALTPADAVSRADAPSTADALTPADDQPQHRTEGLPEIDPERYRRVLGHFPTGVTVVTASTADGPVGLSIGSFTSVSLDPALVGFLPSRTSRSWPAIRASGRFCVNVLAADQAALARRFAAPHDERFDEVAWRPAPFSGAPLLEGAAAWVDCAIEAIVAAGDHDFVLGRVHDLGVVDEAADPLIFFRAGYRTLR